MRWQRSLRRRAFLVPGLAGLALLLGSTMAPAQRAGGVSTGGSGGISFGGTSGGTSGGSSFGSSSGFGSGSSGSAISGSAFGGSGISGSAFGSNSSGGSSGFGGSNSGFGGTQNRNTGISPSTGGTGFGGTGFGGAGGTNLYQGVSQSNVFASHFADPFAIGVNGGTTSTGTGTSRQTFGRPLYNINTQTNSSFGGGVGGQFGGTQGLRGTANITTGAGVGSNNSNSVGPGLLGTGVQPAPYTVTLADTTPAAGASPEAAAAFLGGLRQTVATAPVLPSGQNIQVGLDGNTVVLQGNVGSRQERLLAEALLRLNPNVGPVRNDLAVGGR
jgi:hypothetical protein